jgi:hypothetical protein
MMAVRWAMLALAVALTGAAFGATTMEFQPSAQRLVVTAVTGLLAPLFWSGAGATLSRTALRVVGWSVGAACLAGTVLRAMGGVRQPPARLASACLMLMLIALATLALAAAIEWRLRGKSADAERAREQAGRAATLALALVGALPLWLGPLAEMLARTRPWVVDAVVAVSPLTHLAIASGNDLLRNQWLYDHSNLAALAVSYPGLNTLLLYYATISLALAAVPLAALVQHRRSEAATMSHPTVEDASS